MQLLSQLFKRGNDAIMAALDRSQAVIHFTPDGTILWANDNFCKTLGYSLNEIVGKHHSLFVEPDYAASQDYKDFWNELRSGRFQSAQYKRIGKGGRAVYIEASYNPVHDARGKTVKVVKLATDITVKTLKMKEALDRSQAVISFTLDGTILEANDNFLNAMGYTLAEVKGQQHRMFVEPAYAQRPLNIKGAQIYGRPISRLLRSLLDGSYEAQQFGWRGEPEHPTGKSFHSSKVALSLLLSVIDHKSEEGPIKAFRTSRRELITAISAQTGYRSSNNSPQA